MQSDSCRRIWVILSGFAAICDYLPDGRRQILDLELPGDVVCGLASFSGSEISLKALGDCSICEVSLEGVQGPLSDYPELAVNLFWRIHQRYRRSMTQQVLLGRLDSTERVAQFLYDMATRLGHGRDGGLQVELPMTRDDIADYLGLNTETVSRVFTRLRKRGFVSVQNRMTYCVPDLEALRKIAPLAAQENLVGGAPHSYVASRSVANPSRAREMAHDC